MSIPNAALYDLQHQFIYRVNCFEQTDLLDFYLGRLPAKQREALLNCMLPFPVKPEDVPATGFAAFMIEQIIAGAEHVKNNPLQARGIIDWNRFEQLTKKNETINDIMSTLVGRNFSDFLNGYDQQRIELREKTTTELPRETVLGKPCVQCPIQQEWLHEAMYHHQFTVEATATRPDFSASGSLSGDLRIALEELTPWLKQKSTASLTIRQFGQFIAEGELNNDRLRFRYREIPESSVNFKLIPAKAFNDLVEGFAKDMEFNNSRRAMPAT